MAYALPRVWSLWIYDRHCNLIYHRDWSSIHFSSGSVNGQPSSSSDVSRAPGDTLLPGTSRVAPRGSPALNPNGGAAAASVGPTNNSLPLDEEAKLVYGVVFSLRNMARKLGGPLESFNGYSTSSYTLSHLQTPTMYTFVLITDPPSSSTSSSSSSRTSTGSTLSSMGPSGLVGPGSGIGGASLLGSSSSAGGASQTLQNVLLQIWKGPWIDFVARNPGVEALEREERVGVDDDEGEDEDEDLSSDEEGKAKEPKKVRVAGQAQGYVVGEGNERVQRRFGIDSDAFRDGVERVLAHNKLYAPAGAA